MSRPAKLQMRLFLLSIAHSKIFCRRLRGKRHFSVNKWSNFPAHNGLGNKGEYFFQKKKRIRHNFTQSGWVREGRGGGGGLLVAASSVI